MSTKLMIGVTVFHLVFGLIMPILYLLTARIKLREAQYKRVVFAWIFLAWSIFFFSASVFIATNYVIGMGLGGIVAALIGMLPFGALALLSFLQFIAKYRMKL